MTGPLNVVCDMHVPVVGGLAFRYAQPGSVGHGSSTGTASIGCACGHAVLLIVSFASAVPPPMSAASTDPWCQSNLPLDMMPHVGMLIVAPLNVIDGPTVSSAMMQAAFAL